MPAFVELGERIGADLIVFSALRNWNTFSEQDLVARDLVVILQTKVYEVIRQPL